MGNLLGLQPKESTDRELRQAHHFIQLHVQAERRRQQEEIRLHVSQQEAERRRQQEEKWVHVSPQEAERRRQQEEKWVHEQQEAERRRQEEEKWLRVLQQEQEAESRRHARLLRALRKQRALREQQEAERRRKEERERLREPQEAEAEANLASEIDLYIRTRRKFDTRDPRAYRCSISSIHQDAEVQAGLKDLERFYDVSLEDFIRDEPSLLCSDNGNQVGVRYLTPFRGDNGHRVYGYFCCGGCGREWESAATWKDKWQKCQGCEARNYPYQQYPLQDGGGAESDSKRPHDCARCEMCLKRGRICVPSMYYDVATYGR